MEKWGGGGGVVKEQWWRPGGGVVGEEQQGAGGTIGGRGGLLSMINNFARRTGFAGLKSEENKVNIRESLLKNEYMKKNVFSHTHSNTEEGEGHTKMALGGLTAKKIQLNISENIFSDRHERESHMYRPLGVYYA